MDPSVEVWPLPSRRRQEGAGGQEEKRRIESLKDLMRDSGTAWEGPGSDKVWPGKPAVGVNSKENHNRGQQVPAVPTWPVTRNSDPVPASHLWNLWDLGTSVWKLPKQHRWSASSGNP